MKIITPDKISREVKIRDIWRVFVDSMKIKWAMRSPFEGRFPSASSISHCQTTNDDPLRFFVLGNSWHVFEGAPMKLKKFFGWPRVRTIINPLITANGHKKNRVKEGCMSWDYDKIKKMTRWQIVDLEYWTFFGKRKKKMYLYRAALCQHEINHMDNLTMEEIWKHNDYIRKKSSYELA